MARGYNYLFLENDSDDPKLTKEQKSELAKHVQIIDPLDGDKVVDGVISYDDHSGTLTKFRMFRGEILKDGHGMPLIDYLPRQYPQPKYKVVYLTPEPVEQAAPVEEAKPEELPEPVAEHAEG